jgi:hypothetical protein
MREPMRGLTFEDVWAAMMETDRRFKETDRQIKETGQKIQAVSEQIGQLGNRIGKIVELLMTPNLTAKFQEMGYTFTKFSRNVELKDDNKNALAEIDVFIENGIYALAVEVKTSPCGEDVKDHVRRMAALRRYADAHGDHRKFLGAVAAPGFPESVRVAALRAGFFVVEASEEAVSVSAPEGNKPKEW